MLLLYQLHEQLPPTPVNELDVCHINVRMRSSLELEHYKPSPKRISGVQTNVEYRPRSYHDVIRITTLDVLLELE